MLILATAPMQHFQKTSVKKLDIKYERALLGMGPIAMSVLPKEEMIKNGPEKRYVPQKVVFFIFKKGLLFFSNAYLGHGAHVTFS